MKKSKVTTYRKNIQELEFRILLKALDKASRRSLWELMHQLDSKKTLGIIEYSA